MSDATAGLTMREWHERFTTRDGRCPWPGPRPYRASDGRRFLVGRDDDIKRFRQAVDEHTLVFLAGRSGVGKSSLTNAALVPDLRTAGHSVAVCDNWDGLQEDAVAYIAGVVFEQFRDILPGFEAPTKRIFDELARLAASGHASIVLILDQFEELVRYSPRLAAEVEEMVLTLNRHTRIRIVISFRSEFLDQLRDLQKAAQRFTSTTFNLAEIDARHAVELMRAPNDDDAVRVIDEAAIDALVIEWDRAREQTASVSDIDPFGKVGFLHLQALLYALHRAAPEGHIDLEVVRGLSAATGAELFHDGIRRSITGKLDDCMAAADGADRYLLQGARAAVAATARHLSSGGYKLVQDAVGLATLSLQDVFHALENGIRASGAGTEAGSDGPLPAGHRDTLVQRLLDEGGWDEDVAFDLMRDTTERIAEVLDREAEQRGDAPPGRTWTDRLHCDAPPWEADPKDVTNGPMMGRSPVTALIEECRRYAIGIRWLQAASLIRLTRSRGQRAMVSLVHDGFGPALNDWAAEQRRSPVSEFHSMTRPTGGDFSWEDDASREHTEGTVDEPLVFANLRWRGAWVHASFRHCVFVNCDFRGTYFFRTSFEAAHFVNCLLDGAIFDDCEVRGPINELNTEVPWYDTGPWFEVEAPAELRRSLARHQPSSVQGSKALLSRDPGYPAIPLDETAEQPDVPRIELRLQSFGGLLIYGGRLSAMVMRGTRFLAQGAMAFRHVAGAGLDLVGSIDGRVEVFGSALRHLTLTFDPVARDTQGEETSQSMRLRTVNSSLAQSWVGHDVVGLWTIEDCKLTQLFNGSDAMQVRVGDDSFCSGTVFDAADRRASGLASGRYDRMDAQANPARRADAARRKASGERLDP